MHNYTIMHNIRFKTMKYAMTQILSNSSRLTLQI